MRLTSYLCAGAIALICTSCTIEQNGAHTDAELHEPFTYQPWESLHRSTASGQEACAVSSGYNGLTFVVRKTAQGNIVSVQSNRFMRAGTQITVTVNGHRYETSNPYFSSRDAVAMAEDFSEGDKAFAEWSELKAYNGRSHYTTVYKLAGFKQKFDSCQK